MSKLPYKPAKLYDYGGDLSKRWRVDYYYTHPETGKFHPFRKWVPILHTKKARRLKAKEIIQEINDKLDDGFNPFESEIKPFTKLTEAMASIVEFKENTQKKNASRNYKSRVNQLVEWLKEKNIASIKVGDFNKAMAYEFLDKKKNNGNKISNRTWNNYVIDFRALWNEMINRGYTSKNPWKDVKKLKAEETELKFFSDSEIKIIKDYLIKNDPDLWFLSMLIFYAALRPQEIMRLRFRDFNVREGKIFLSGKQTKNSRAGIIRIKDTLQEEFEKNYPEKYPPSWYLFSRRLRPGDIENHTQRIHERWDIMRKATGITTSIYAWKHTFALKMVDMDLHQMMIHFRHSSLEQTQKYLDRIRNEVTNEFLDAIPVL